MLCAAIDIGSNTTRVLVAEPVDGQLKKVMEQRAYTRINKALDADGAIVPEKVSEVAQVVATQVRLARELGADVIRCVERMGDQCVNICKLIPLSGHEPPADEEMLRRILMMGRQVRTQIAQAKRSFENRDIDMARDLVRQDDVVDNLNRECFHLALEIGDDADRREWAMTMLLAARAIERIGDNAVDIGEQVAFVVTGLFREFEDASHPSA